MAAEQIALVYSTSRHDRRQGGHYTAEWVRALARAIRHHWPSAPPIVVLTDDRDLGARDLVHVVRRNCSLAPGWWAKIFLFEPGLFQGNVLYFDLDILLFRSPAALAAQDPGEGVIMLTDVVPDLANSSIMLWRADADWATSVWATYWRAPERVRARYTAMPRLGDQALIEDVCRARRVRVGRWQSILPPLTVTPFCYGGQVHSRMTRKVQARQTVAAYCLGHPKFDTRQSLPVVRQHWMVDAHAAEVAG